VFRLVPMLVFLVVPFMEFLLPVALRLLPNMLPSTFEDKLKKEEELKKRVGAKLEVARFLQARLPGGGRRGGARAARAGGGADGAPGPAARAGHRAGDGREHEEQQDGRHAGVRGRAVRLPAPGARRAPPARAAQPNPEPGRATGRCDARRARAGRQVRAGEVVSQYEIMRFAQLFNDELTLDNLERIHLVNLCRFVGIQPFGTDAFLVSRLRTHLAAIKARAALCADSGLSRVSGRPGACRPAARQREAGRAAAEPVTEPDARPARRARRRTTVRSRRRAWTT